MSIWTRTGSIQLKLICLSVTCSAVLSGPALADSWILERRQSSIDVRGSNAGDLTYGSISVGTADTSQADLFTAAPSEPTPDPLVGQTVEACMATQGTSAARTKATGGAASTSLAQAAGPQALFQNQSDSLPCSVCGSITVRSGACYQCTNCGASTGCG